MEFMEAKKLFSPPDRLDGTKQHLINMVNKGFENLAMELCQLAPKSHKLDEIINDLNKARLLFNHSIEIMKEGKQAPAETKQAKVPKTPKDTKPAPELEPEAEKKEEEIEGFG